MKKILLLTFLLAAIQSSSLFAQIVEGTPCTAACMDPTKSTITGKNPNQNGVSPNVNLPCGSGTSEDNPAWWIIRPKGNSLTFQFTSSNCVAGGCGIGIQMTLWEGDACGSVTALNCIVGTSGILTSTTTPCRVYYLQIDGLCETQCDVVLTYDKNQILTKVDKPTITGPSQLCKGASGKFTASIPSMPGCRPDSWKWTLEPASAGTASSVTGSDDAIIKVTGTIPANGKIKICAEPVFKGKCPPTTQKECYEVEILELKPALCDVIICPDTRPLLYDLKECIKSTNPTFNSPFTPETFIIGNTFLPGTEKTQKLTYTVTGSGCKGDIELKVKVLNLGDTMNSKFCKCVALAGTMQSKLIITASNINKNITVSHKIGTDKIGTGETFAYILHEGNADKIVNQLAINQTGMFAFDATKMKCNKVYYVSYVVGMNLNGLPNPADKCYSIVPKGQPVVWLCGIKKPVAAAREGADNIFLTENANTEIGIYPNPADDNFFITLPMVKNATLNLFDMQGKIVLSQNDMIQYDDFHYEAQVSDLPKGVYLLKLNLDGKPEVRKIIVE